MAMSLDDWNGVKWVLAVVVACLLYFMGDLNAGILAGLVLGVLIPTTDIAQRAGAVAK